MMSLQPGGLFYCTNELLNTIVIFPAHINYTGVLSYNRNKKKEMIKAAIEQSIFQIYG